MTWTVLGWVSSAVVVLSLLQGRRRRLHALNLLGCALAALYSSALGIWPTVGLNVALVAVNAVQLVRQPGHTCDPEPAPTSRTTP